MPPDRFATRFESPSRYYVARLDPDLFDGWVLTIAWGGKFNERGQVRRIAVPDQAAGFARLESLRARRRARGYTEIPTT